MSQRALTWVLLLLLIALQGKLWLSDSGVRAWWKMNTAVEQQQKTNAELQARNQALEAEVQDLKSGTDAAEERARSEMGMIKEGEVFYQILDQPGAVLPPATPAPAPVSEPVPAAETHPAAQPVVPDNT